MGEVALVSCFGCQRTGRQTSECVDPCLFNCIGADRNLNAGISGFKLDVLWDRGGWFFGILFITVSRANL